MARMLMIAAGYEDCDDVDTLRFDPALKIAVGRAPESGADLMSQPTLSRLENLADWRALARIGLGQIGLYCRSFARPPAAIVLDIDDTDDPVHGQQELAFFNAHHDCTCSSRSTSSTASRASPCCRCCGPASAPRARRWRRSCVTSSPAPAASTTAIGCSTLVAARRVGSRRHHLHSPYTAPVVRYFRVRWPSRGSYAARRSFALGRSDTLQLMGPALLTQRLDQ